MMIVWKSLIEYLGTNLRSGKSVYIKGFGAFTFDIETELPRIANKSVSIKTDLEEQRLERKNIHRVK